MYDDKTSLWQEEEARLNYEANHLENQRIDKIRELEAENKILKIKIRDLNNKLYQRNRAINQMHRDSFESVDFYDDRRE